MAQSWGEIVLLTGVQGFLGRRVLEQLCKDDTVMEIRGLDKLPENNEKESMEIGDKNSKRIKFYGKDLIDLESCREIMKDVDVVIHCAALVNYDFPAPQEALHKNNVLATENLLQLCIEEGVKRFIHCSTTEVTLQSYGRGGIIAMITYANESKIGTPENEDRLIFGEYAASKLRAEKLVLEANGKSLANGRGVLHTLALRPTLLYGEGDEKYIGKFLEIGNKRGNILQRLAGAGGKQQVTYVGNAAWAFVCAKNKLRDNPESVAGIPITITDDTPIVDVLRFCQKMTMNGKIRINLSSWSVPLIISYFCAWFLEIVASFNFGFLNKLPISPRNLIAYMGSLILYDRTRASIRLNYDPCYKPEEAMARASSYYCELLDKSK